MIGSVVLYAVSLFFKLMTNPVELKRAIRKFIVPALTLLAGISIGFMLRDLTPGKSKHEYFEIRQGGWKYINPLLECEQARNTMENNELKPFRGNVEKFIKNDLNKKWGDDISVYFRELNNGLSFSIGRTEQFYPASLLKVPLMISVLRQADTDPKILTKKIVYNNPDFTSAQNTDVAQKLEFGKSYTVEDLLKRTIEFSDNVSFLLLEGAVDPVYLKAVYDDLGIPDPYYLNDQSGYVLSTEQYSSFFRILFNASYLSKEKSEKALELLSKTDYTKGLVAGVPLNIAVAHKFGLRKINGIKQLHDCGIVYYPNHPYLLCVMTSGPTPEYLDSTIADISRFIYKEIDHQHGIY